MAVDPKHIKIGDLLETPKGEFIRVVRIDAVNDLVIFDDQTCASFGVGVPKWWWNGCTLLAGKRSDLPGLAPDTPTTTNDAGGKQSAVPYRSDLIPPKAILLVANVLHDGAKKYGDDNWHAIGTRDHINHAMTHVFAYLAGDKQDKHLEHAATRLLMALEIDARGSVKRDAQQ